eukprot:2818217-Prymnesium_polylepis.1
MPQASPDVEHGAAAPSISFRDLQTEDLEVVKELHQQLFPVQYSDSFYSRLFSPGHFCIVGLVQGEIVAVASARTVDNAGEPSRE